MDVSTDAFAKAAQSVAENTPRALEAVTKWQGVQLPQGPPGWSSPGVRQASVGMPVNR